MDLAKVSCQITKSLRFFRCPLSQAFYMFFLASLEFGLSEKPGMAATDGSNSFRRLLILGFNAWKSEFAPFFNL